MAIRPARIILTTIGSLGDIHPMIRLALSLKQQGHDVCIATIQAYQNKIESAGINFHPIRPNLSPEDPEILRYVTDLRRGPEYILREIMMPHLRDTYRDLEVIVKEGCDLLLAGETVFAAPLIAEKYCLRWGAVILSPSSFFSVYDPPVIPGLAFSKQLRRAPVGFHRLLKRLAIHKTNTWCQEINGFRSVLGLKATKNPIFGDKFSPHINLALFSEVLAKPQHDWPGGVVQPGFIFYDSTSSERKLPTAIEEFLNHGVKPVIFTLGSAAVHSSGSFYTESIEALKQIDKPGILLIGKNEIKEELPENIICSRYLPLSKILARSECIVHQGGSGTVAQALRAGTPQLIVPYSNDQPDNAARIEGLGVGYTISRERLSAQEVAASINKLLLSKYIKNNCLEVARTLKNEHSLEKTLEAINKQLLYEEVELNEVFN